MSYHKLNVSDRMSYLSLAKKSGLSYREAVDKYNEPLEQFGEGGTLPKSDATHYYTSDINDPRFQSYKDSLYMNNQTNKWRNVVKKDNPGEDFGYVNKEPEWFRGDNKTPYFNNPTNEKEVGWMTDRRGIGLLPIYKKPTQQVIYQHKPQVKANVVKPKPVSNQELIKWYDDPIEYKKALQARNDSSSLYKNNLYPLESGYVKTEEHKMSDFTQKGHVGSSSINSNNRYSDYTKGDKIQPIAWQTWDKSANVGKYMGTDIDTPIYQKPIVTPKLREQKPIPLVAETVKQPVIPTPIATKQLNTPHYRVQQADWHGDPFYWFVDSNGRQQEMTKQAFELESKNGKYPIKQYGDGGIIPSETTNQPIQQDPYLKSAYLKQGSKLQQQEKDRLALEYYNKRKNQSMIGIKGTPEELDKINKDVSQYSANNEINNKYKPTEEKLSDLAFDIGISILPELPLVKIAKRIPGIAELSKGKSIIQETKSIEKPIEEIKKLSEILPQQNLEKPNWSNWNNEIPSNTKLLEEYHNVENKTKRDGTWMKNTDGSKFNGTPEQFVQQNSENFKKAFPQGHEEVWRGVIEHRQELNPEKSVFTANKSLAEQYSVNKEKLLNSSDSDWISGMHRLAHNKSTNSLTFDGMMNGWTDVSTEGMQATKQSINANIEYLEKQLEKTKKDLSGATQNWDKSWNIPGSDIKYSDYLYQKGTKDQEEILSAYKDRLKNIDNFVDNPKELEKMKNVLGKRTTTDEIAKYIENNNLDYIKIKNINDGGFGDISIVNHKKNKYLKSLVGNNGMFDMTNPNIYKGMLPPALMYYFQNQSNKQNGKYPVKQY